MDITTSMTVCEYTSACSNHHQISASFRLPIHDSQSDDHSASIIQHKNCYIFKIEIYSAHGQKHTHCSTSAEWAAIEANLNNSHDLIRLIFLQRKKALIEVIAVVSQVQTKHFN